MTHLRLFKMIKVRDNDTFPYQPKQIHKEKENKIKIMKCWFILVLPLIFGLMGDSPENSTPPNPSKITIPSDSKLQ